MVSQGIFSEDLIFFPCQRLTETISVELVSETFYLYTKQVLSLVNGGERRISSVYNTYFEENVKRHATGRNYFA